MAISGDCTKFLIYAFLSLASLVTASNSDPSQAATICARPDSDSILVAHEDCDKFYKCFQGEPHAISCPGNLLYNPYKEYCDWPENVECLVNNDNIKDNFIDSEYIDVKENVPLENDDIVDEEHKMNIEEAINENENGNKSNNNVKESKDEADKSCSEYETDGKLIAHEDCHKFYECSGGKAVALDCPDDLRYNPEKKYCDWPDNVTCD